MLVLSRSQGEVVRIGDDVEVVVVRIGPDRVRLGITAPQKTHIVRGELPPLDMARVPEMGLTAHHVTKEAT